MSPFFCVRTSPEPYGARAGQRLPAQRLDPQGAEKEKMPVKKKLTAVCVLMAAVCLFAGTTYYEYRKHGQIEWTGLILLFAGLVLTLTAPLYIWTIAGV